ncbi:MAG: hypothetical protein KOO60_05110 [Gemmatimonadales bacterium]|nr:hypothetical protein [Gemmatimonadales bacterium]
MRQQRIYRLVVALGLFAWGGWLLRGYVTDDTFIHLRYARNLLELGEFSFNPGQSTYGATSPLWIFGLVLFLKIGFTPLAAIWILGALSGLAVILLVDLILGRMTFPEHWKPIFLALIASDVWFLRWTFSGMETPLATLLLLVLLWPLFSGRDRGWGVTREKLWVRYLAWGVAAGLAGLTRPEFLLVAPLALPWLLWFEYYRAVGGSSNRYQSRPHGPLLAAIAGWIMVVGPWLVFANFAFGRITPGTASAKSAAISFTPVEWIDSIIRSLKQLAVVQGPLWGVAFFLVLLVLYKNRSIDKEEGDYTGPLKLGIPLLDKDEAFHPRQASEPGHAPTSIWSSVALMGIALTWTVVLLGGYAVKEVWIISRYVCPLTPVILLALAVFAEWLLSGKQVGGPGILLGRIAISSGVVVTLILNWGIMVTQVVPHARKFPEGLQECYVGFGQWLNENTAPDAVVAALDIGALGYVSERRVLDLMGLVSPEILSLGSETGFQEMVESGDWLKVNSLDALQGARPQVDARQPDGSAVNRPNFFVDRCEGPARWEGRTVHGVRFELLDTCTISGVGLREPQPWTIALYRLVWTDNLVNASEGG